MQLSTEARLDSMRNPLTVCMLVRTIFMGYQVFWNNVTHTVVS
jgi:hypothetical protein